MIDANTTAFIKTILLQYEGGTHYHFGELAWMLLRDNVKSTADPTRFTLWTRDNKESRWIMSLHINLLLNKVRNTIVDALHEAQYALKSRPSGSSTEDWSKQILRLLDAQERLYNHTFMKCVLEEFILLAYSPV